MNIQHNISLQPYNTMHVNVRAKYFSAFSSADELSELLDLPEMKNEKKMILGGGSNVLFTGDFNGWILKNQVSGLEIVKEDTHHVYVKAGAGENWHAFTQYCIGRNWAGVENLSLIPGNVGAGPMQNIGAYGVEIKDVFEELEAYSLSDKKTHVFSQNDCEFGYRESVFKGKYRNQFIILNVTFRLNKVPKFKTTYGAIEQELQRMGVNELSISAIAQAVINIRQSKLPDPSTIGNAGSFFKNPSVERSVYESLKKEFPAIVGYDNPDGTVKLAAGWLIEHSGPDATQSWKGYRRGDAGVHAHQALVLVNYGNAKGEEVYALSEEVLQSVKAKYGVLLEREVNLIK
jgi:UDP-N-acetylmuramate dehydrogenase